MTNYVIDGKLGAGKSLIAVHRMQQALLQGRRVATNLDLYLEHLLPANHKGTVTRVPDKPRLEDLEALGTGDGKPVEEYDESGFGDLVLDECVTWLNSREWADKERAQLLKWFVHARKLHWNVYFLIQDHEQLDKSVKGSLVEYWVHCRRLDRLPIPVVSFIWKFLWGSPVYFPRLHFGRVRYGFGRDSISVERWTVRGSGIQKGYRTGQVFHTPMLFTDKGETVDMRASYTLLSPYHLVGRYQASKVPLSAQIGRLAARGFVTFLGLCLWAAGVSSPAQALIRAGVAQRRAPVADLA